MNDRNTEGHILAALSTLIILMLMGLHPLASRYMIITRKLHNIIAKTCSSILVLSSLLYIKPTDFVRPPIGVPKFGTVGINETLLVSAICNYLYTGNLLTYWWFAACQ